MNLWFRLLLTLLLSPRRPRSGLMNACLTPFRVLPSDLDTAVHMNNGVYFSLSDLARVDYMIRSRTLAILRRRRWFPVVAAETIQFHRALQPFERFFIETLLVGWDERTFFIRHRFFRHRVDGELAAEVWIRGLMARKSGGTLPISELIDALGNPPRPAPMPDWVVAWAAAMDANRERHKRGSAPAPQG